MSGKTWTTVEVCHMTDRPATTPPRRVFPLGLPAIGSGNHHQHDAETVRSALIWSALLGDGHTTLDHHVITWSAMRLLAAEVAAADPWPWVAYWVGPEGEHVWEQCDEQTAAETMARLDRLCVGLLFLDTVLAPMAAVPA